jgi:hypothetical protein
LDSISLAFTAARQHPDVCRSPAESAGPWGYVAALRFFFVRILKRRALKDELPTPKRHSCVVAKWRAMCARGHH